MALTSYDQGDLVRCSAAFTNAAGSATDPTTITFKYEDPSGNEATFVYPTNAELVKDSTGNYHVDLTPDETGVWSFRFIGTGTVAQVVEDQFYVQPTDITGSTIRGGFNELRERVYAYVHDSDRLFITEAEVDIWLQEGLDDLASRLRLTQNVTTGTTSGSTITLPSDFNSLIWFRLGTTDYALWVDDNTYNYAESESLTYDFSLARVFNNTINIYPTPTTGTAYTIRYWSMSPTSLSGIGGNLKIRLVNYAISRAKAKEGDYRGAEYFLSTYERGLPAPSNVNPNSPIMPNGMTFAPGPFDDVDARHF